MKDKLLARTDIQSFLYQCPVEEFIDIFKTSLRKKLEVLSSYPFPKLFKLSNFVPIIVSSNMINNFINRNFDNLCMGSPLIGILACLFLEFLESGLFKYILLKDIYFF